MQVHPSQIYPGAPYDVFYFLRNHTDATTYYVRAVIYDLRTGDVLDRQNLAQSANNSRLFTARLQAPGDSSGVGRNIVAIATVYTDNGYTTKSTDYEEQEQYFLIRAEQQVFGGGGVDYRALRDIVREELDQAVKTIPAPAEVPYDALFGAIGALQREVNRVPKDIPNIEPITTALENITALIRSLPQSRETDLSPVLTALATLKNDIASAREDIKATARGVTAGYGIEVRKLQDELLQKIETGITDALGKLDLTVPFSAVFSRNKPVEAPAEAIRSLLA